MTTESSSSFVITERTVMPFVVSRSCPRSGSVDGAYDRCNCRALLTESRCCVEHGAARGDHVFDEKHVASNRIGTLCKPQGADPVGRNVLLIEDVITTGGAVLNAATALREQGATVTSVVCAIDRSGPWAGQTHHKRHHRSLSDDEGTARLSGHGHLALRSGTTGISAGRKVASWGTVRVAEDVGNGRSRYRPQRHEQLGQVEHRCRTTPTVGRALLPHVG